MQLASPPFQVWSPGSPFDPGNSYAEGGDLDQAEPLALQAVNRTTDNLYGEEGGEGEEDSKVAVSLLLTGIISFRCARQMESSGQCPTKPSLSLQKVEKSCLSSHCRNAE